jgi:hypothetical protein
MELEWALHHRRVVVIHGAGGLGKTEVAKAFARWLRDTGGLDDPSWAFFHSFEPGLATLGLGGALNSVGLRLHGADFAGLDAVKRREVVLAGLRRQRMLLIWDNFETVHSSSRPDQATPPLGREECEEVRSFLAEVAHEARGGILITSRSREEWLGGPEIHRLELGGLSREDTHMMVDLLLAAHPLANERRRDRAFATLLEALGGHPLSLRLMLPQLERAPDAQHVLEALDGEGQPIGALAASIRYSFRDLSAEDQKRLPALALFEGVADVDVLWVLSRSEGTPQRFAGAVSVTW